MGPREANQDPEEAERWRLAAKAARKNLPHTPKPKRKPSKSMQTVMTNPPQTSSFPRSDSSGSGVSAKRRTIKTLNVDPGFNWLGWSVTELHGDIDVVLAMGLIRTEASSKKRNVRTADDSFRRGRELSEELVTVMNLHKPDAICFESMSHVRSSSSMAKVGMCYGALTMLVTVARLPVVAATPNEVKKAAAKAAGVKTLTGKDPVAAAMFEKYRHHEPSKVAIQQFLDQPGALVGRVVCVEPGL